MKNKYFIFITLLYFLNSHSQTIIYVRSNLNNELLTNAILSAYQNEKLVFFSKSDNYGKIYIDSLSKYSKIVISKFGFEDLELEKIEHNRTYYLSKISDVPIIIDEVNIVGHKSYIHQKRDTLIYQAEQLRNDFSKNVSDLLKNIPGIAVDKLTGKTYYNNKEITTILVDGENIVNSNYQIISNNLTEKLVKSVQIIEGFSANDLLKNFYKNDRVVINIISEEEHKKKLNGNLLAGMGIENKYKSDNNLFLLKENLKTINILQYNNIGAYSTGENIDNKSISDFLVLMNDTKFDFQNITNFNQTINLKSQNGYKFIPNSDFFISSNNNIKILKNTQLITSINYYKDKFEYSNRNNFIFLDSVNSYYSYFNDQPKKFYSDIAIISKLTDKSNLNSKIILINNFDVSSHNNNYTNQNIDFSNHKSAFILKSDFTKRINSKNAYIFTYSIINERYNENMSSDFGYAHNFNYTNVHNNISTNYIHKINNKNILSTGLFYNFNTLNLKGKISDNPEAQKLSLNEWSFQMQYSFYSFKNQFISLVKFDKQVNNKKISVLPNISYHRRGYKSDFNINYERLKLQEDFYLKLSNHLLISENQYIKHSADNNIFYQLNNINLNYLFKNENVNNEWYINANYYFGNKSNIVNNNFVDSFFLKEIINGENNIKNLSLSLGIEKFLPKSNIYLKYIPNINFNEWYYVNLNIKNKNQSYQLLNKISLKSNFDIPFNFYLSYINTKTNIFTYSNLKRTNNIYFKNNLVINFYINPFGEQHKFSLFNEWIKYNNVDDIYYLSSKYAYNPKKSKINIEFELNNILNSKFISNRTFNDDFVVENNYTIINRIFLLSLNYIF